MNASETERQVHLQVSGPQGLSLLATEVIELAPADTRTVPVTVRLDAAGNDDAEAASTFVVSR